uniref:Uncharacterized protein n=1 Tax=Ascaris lumbricoides TaxID=6252 RepID=A0A0M3HL80_ASCLU
MEPMKCQHGVNYLTYKTKLTPVRYHYRGSYRVGDIVIEGQPGAFILSLVFRQLIQFQSFFPRTNICSFLLLNIRITFIC